MTNGLETDKNLKAQTVPLIRAANVLPLVRFMDVNRLDTAQRLADADLSYWFFLHPMNVVPTLNGLRLLHDLARDLGPDVGAKIVQEASVAELAFIGGVALGSITPADALQRIAFAMPLHSTHENFSVSVSQGQLVLEHSFKMTLDAESHHYVQMMLLSMVQQVFRATALTPPFFIRIEAVPHPDTGLDFIEKHFKADIVAASGPLLKLTMAEKITNVSFKNPARDRSKTMDISQIPPLAEDDSLSGSIRPVISAMLNDGEPTIDRVAFSAGMPVRTLQRRLAAEGTSFSEQIDVVRRRLALGVIGREDATLEEITERLGYSGPSALSRAVRRLTGQPPSALRKDASSG